MEARGEQPTQKKQASLLSSELVPQPTYPAPPPPFVLANYLHASQREERIRQRKEMVNIAGNSEEHHKRHRKNGLSFLVLQYQYHSWICPTSKALRIEDIRGVLGNKCAGQQNLKTVQIREIMWKLNIWRILFCT